MSCRKMPQVHSFLTSQPITDMFLSGTLTYFHSESVLILKQFLMKHEPNALINT